MKHLSTAFLTVVLAIAVFECGGVTAEDDHQVDEVAEEARNRAVTIIDGPKYVSTQPPSVPEPNSTTRPEVHTPKPVHRPPSKPPLIPDKPVKQTYFVDLSSHFYGQLPKLPPPRPYPIHKLQPSQNSVYKFPKVIPLLHHKSHYYIPRTRPLRLAAAASTSKPSVTSVPKFSLPVQTINGIRTDFVRPPKLNSTTTTTTSTTTETTTTTRALRTKRIWPKRETFNSTLHNATIAKDNSSNAFGIRDQDTSASQQRVRVLHRQTSSTTIASPTKRSYRPVTRSSKIKYANVPTAANFTMEPNDWVPIVPSHYPSHKIKKITSISRRSDGFFPDAEPSQVPVPGKNMMYLQSFRLLPVQPTQIAETTPTIDRKRMVYFKKKRQLNPYNPGYSTIKLEQSPVSYISLDDVELQTEASQARPRVVTKIKHHHHHHHHKYIKTVEKKVPYKVEVPKPFPVPVEKKVTVPVEKIKYVDKPYPVTVEKKVPYPIGIKVPQPMPVKVVEKEYIPKPYPIVHHVPVVKRVEVKVPQPYPVEKRVPYPVEVKVPVHIDRPVPVAVPVERRVPYPVPVRVLVPQPYPVETKVPYRVEVKEPVEVIKHVPIRVPVPQPFAVKVPHPVPVHIEKKVPYPVEVEKKVPVPFEVIVPERVEVEKKVPVYIPKPYPVEKRVPYPVKVPYPVRVPVRVPVQVPVEVPVYIHSPMIYEGEGFITYGDNNDVSTAHSASPQNVETVTVHGNGAYSLIESRSDNADSPHSVTTSKPLS